MSPKNVEEKNIWPKVWYDKGVDYLKTGKLEKGIECFKRAIKDDPNFAEAWFWLGKSYSELDNLEKVIDCNLKVVEIDPQFKAAWNFLAVAYLSTGKYEKAIESFEKVYDLEPTKKNEKIVSLLKNKFIQDKKQLIISKPFESPVPEEILDAKAKKWYVMGNMFYDSGNYKKAIKFYKKIVKVSPQFKDAWEKMSKAYGKIGDFKKMNKCSEKAQKI